LRVNFLFVIVFCHFSFASAEDAVPKLSWQTFHSDQGYELRVPTCWASSIDDPDEQGAVTAAEHVQFNEGSPCARPRHDVYIPNGIAIGAEAKFKTPESRTEEINNFEKYMKRRLAEKENILVKRYKIGSDEAIAYIRYMESKNRIQWRVRLFCPSRSFDIMIMTLKDPAQQYFDKFKNGDLALPEPEKTVLESIKCVDPKPAQTGQKQKSTKSKGALEHSK